jgi:hypothetical protein
MKTRADMAVEARRPIRMALQLEVVLPHLAGVQAARPPAGLVQVARLPLGEPVEARLLLMVVMLVARRLLQATAVVDGLLLGRELRVEEKRQIPTAATLAVAHLHQGTASLRPARQE